MPLVGWPRRLPKPWEAPAKIENRNALRLPRVNKLVTPTATPGLLHLPDAARENTFRKASRLVVDVPKVLASSTAATFNPGMQRTRESLFNFTIFAYRDVLGFLPPRSLHSLTCSILSSATRQLSLNSWT